jgi:hypothetical protein
MQQVLRSRPKIDTPNPVGWRAVICPIEQEVAPMLRFWMEDQMALLVEQKAIRVPLVWLL